MKIIVGLGNPGFRYKNTKHNVGFMVIDEISKKHNIRVKKHGFQGVYGVGRVDKTEVLLLKPLTFMNLSGQAVKAVCSEYVIDNEDLLVISDDYNLPMGALRIKGQGSAGGHNGLSSIIDLIGQDFSRLRIGIGRDEMPEEKSGYVLSRFIRKDKMVINEAISKACECAELWLNKGLIESAQAYNVNN